MPLPLLPSRIKKPGLLACFWVDACKVGTFVMVGRQFLHSPLVASRESHLQQCPGCRWGKFILQMDDSLPDRDFGVVSQGDCGHYWSSDGHDSPFGIRPQIVSFS